MCFLYFLVRVCIDRLGAVPANPSYIAKLIPGTWSFKKGFLGIKKLTISLRTVVVQLESLKALHDDIRQERRVRQQHRTEPLEH